jgi:hypothetical protein
MARVNGPFLSLDASGTIYNTLTASIWKGRNYMRGYFVPTNPQTPAQVAQRDLMRQAVEDWQASYPGEHTLWDEAARDVYPPISGYNYFVMQWLLQGAYPTIPAVAPKKSKVIHNR